MAFATNTWGRHWESRDLALANFWHLACYRANWRENAPAGAATSEVPTIEILREPEHGVPWPTASGSSSSGTAPSLPTSRSAGLDLPTCGRGDRPETRCAGSHTRGISPWW